MMDDLQEAYNKLYKDFVKSFRKSTEAKLENVKFEKDELIVTFASRVFSPNSFKLEWF